MCDDPPTKTCSRLGRRHRGAARPPPDGTTASAAGSPLAVAVGGAGAEGAAPERDAVSRVAAAVSTGSSASTGQFDRRLLDGTVVEDDDQQGPARCEPDELDRADGGRLVGRADDHGRVVGQVGQEAAGAAEQLLDLAVDVGEELAHLLALLGTEPARAGQVVDEEPVPLVRRDPAGAGVGLDEVAVALERRHLAADGGRGHLDTRGR